MRLFQGPLTAVLCLSLTGTATPGSAEAASTPSARPAYRSNQLQGDARILHVLNRFTFGPRPGDLDAIRAIGLENWFDLQLHPASINQADLNFRLAEFPAMQ